jgi:hypothetical protein
MAGSELTFVQARMLEISKRDPERYAAVKAYFEKRGVKV